MATAVKMPRNRDRQGRGYDTVAHRDVPRSERPPIPMNRRHFLSSSAALSAVAFPALSLTQTGKTYTTALVGAGWWGGNILGEAMAAKRSKIVGVCDVDDQALDATLAKVNQLTADTPRRYKDFRELIAKEKPEIVIVATPDPMRLRASRRSSF